MMSEEKSRLLLSLAAVLLGAPAFSQVPQSAYVNFEGSQTNPIRLSADGTRLFAVNTPDARLSVFDTTSPSSPRLIAEIPVGIEPVSVNPRTNDEVWVVNQESDSVSIVSVSRGIVTDTIYVPDEPADIVFAGANLAFVSVSRSNQIRVFDTNTHALVQSIPVFGNNPRAMAVSLDGKTVYAAFALSGNHTTIIPSSIAPPQVFPPGATAPQPAPQVALIADASDPNWRWYIRFSMPDNDVVAINTSTLAVAGYFSHVGTINLGIAVRPVTGEIYVANTDALNLTHYESALRGHWINSRITKIAGAAVTPFDLNPGIDYATLPNPSALATALSQPASVIFHPSGAAMYVASFGTDRVAIVDPSGNVLARVELESTAAGANVDSVHKRGPRGLALNAAANVLYVSNRLSNTISLINSSAKVFLEIPIGSFDPTPLVIRTGRGFLYDAKLSGNGTGSCASCHVDADMDHLAWDLGNPFAQPTTTIQNGRVITFHPMKGPMTTQTLKGLASLSPYHWRGDKPNFQAFNGAFDSLMGGPQLTSLEMNAFTNFVNTIVYQPNPFENLDRTLPTSLVGGNAVNGRDTFINAPLMLPSGTCNTCHTSNPGPGTNRGIQDNNALAPIKIPQLRNIYQKQFFNRPGPATIDGFGMDHAGDISTMAEFFSSGLFTNYSAQQKTDMAAFSLAFDTGTAPAVGYTRTITASNLGNAGIQSDWTLLQNQAAAGNIDLIAKGTIAGAIHGLLYQPGSNNYATDKTGLGPFTQAQLQSLIQQGDTLSFMGVPPGSGLRMGIERKLNGVLDGN